MYWNVNLHLNRKQKLFKSKQPLQNYKKRLIYWYAKKIYPQTLIVVIIFKSASNSPARNVKHVLKKLTKSEGTPHPLERKKNCLPSSSLPSLQFTAKRDEATGNGSKEILLSPRKNVRRFSSTFRLMARFFWLIQAERNFRWILSRDGSFFLISALHVKINAGFNLKADLIAKIVKAKLWQLCFRFWGLSPSCNQFETFI